MALRKRKYLNNRDLLSEISKSKNSYSSYVNPEDAEYDIILDSIDSVNRNTISQARKNRADRIAKANWEVEAAVAKGVKQDKFSINHLDIPKTDVVFRIKTFDHVPEEPGRKKNPKTVADHHVKLNFPPYQHWRLDENDKLFCVGKSHWIGGMENGYFSLDHGGMTNTLAKMYMVMCERYGSKWNWRGYTYNDEMKSQALLQLSQVGLQFDESKSDNPFAYYTATITNSFTRVLNIEKKNQNIRDDMLESHGYKSSHTRALNSHIKWKEETGQRTETGQ
jgi:hypothetical protein